MSDCAQLFTEALELGKQRKYSEAIVRLRKIVSETDEVEEAFLYLGRSYHALGAYPQAIDMLRRFAELRPQSAAGFFFLGRALLSAKEYHKAGEMLHRALSLRPDIRYARSLLGYIYLKLGRSSRALELLTEAVQEEPENANLYNGYLNALLVEGIKSFKRGYYDYAEEAFSFILARGKKGILPYLYLGMIHRMQGEYTKALNDYQNALRYSPNDELITYRIALLMQKTGRYDEAAELFARLQPESGDTGRVSTPTGPEADRYLARKYFDRGEYSQALHFALQVLHGNTEDTAMHLIAGECYREMGKYELGGNHFKRIFDKDRNHVGAHYGLALIHWQLEEYEEMLSDLRRIERLDPGSTTVHYYTVLCSWKIRKEPEVLLPIVQEAVRSLGPDLNLLNALADTYERGGYDELAHKWYRKVVELDPANLPSYRGLIELYEKGEPFENPEKLFEGYLELVPEDRKRRRSYIHYLYRNNRYRKSIQTIEEYLSLLENPQSSEETYFQRMRAICYRKIEDYDTATELYRRLLKEEPRKEELLRPYIFCLEKSGRGTRAADTAAKAVSFLDSPSSTLCLIAGVLLYKEGDNERALKLFRMATTVDPTDWRGFYNIGEIYKRQGMEGFAARFIQQAETLKQKRKE